MQICPKCGYERKLSDSCPDWQCPHCGVAYCKISHSESVHRSHRKSGAWKILFSFLLLLTIGFFSWLGYQWKTQRIKATPSATAGPSIPEQQATPSLAALNKDPIQIMVEGKIPSFEHKSFAVTPLARFELEAKVLSKENYWLGREAGLSKTDLALGWGAMATDELLDKVEITQRNRWYFWYVSHDFSEELGRQISTHSSNMHIIPATPEVEKQLDDVEKGQIVYIKGYLIQANAKDGWLWRSSLSREDTGDGACELVWAQQLQIQK